MNNRHVVPINILWDKNWYSYNPQIIPYPSEGLHENLHGHKLRPNTDVSIMACFLDNHRISELLKEMKNPEQDLLVFFYPA